MVNTRSGPTLPGLAPVCPHCGERRSTVLVVDSETVGALICAERWECRSCAGVFWALPALAATARR